EPDASDTEMGLSRNQVSKHHVNAMLTLLASISTATPDINTPYIVDIYESSREGPDTALLTAFLQASSRHLPENWKAVAAVWHRDKAKLTLDEHCVGALLMFLSHYASVHFAGSYFKVGKRLDRNKAAMLGLQEVSLFYQCSLKGDPQPAASGQALPVPSSAFLTKFLYFLKSYGVKRSGALFYAVCQERGTVIDTGVRKALATYFAALKQYKTAITVFGDELDSYAVDDWTLRFVSRTAVQYAALSQCDKPWLRTIAAKLCEIVQRSHSGMQFHVLFELVHIYKAMNDLSLALDLVRDHHSVLYTAPTQTVEQYLAQHNGAIEAGIYRKSLGFHFVLTKTLLELYQAAAQKGMPIAAKELEHLKRLNRAVDAGMPRKTKA
ncbi:hypothetical protein HDU91_002605, partial [Kappamyces sp. JEL0680]